MTQILKTETILKADRGNISLTDLQNLANDEITDHVNFLPANSIFKLGNDASTAISDVMRIRNGAIFELNENSNSNDLHFCRSLKCTVRANKSFHLLITPGQDVRVENTGTAAISVWNSHFRETSETGNTKTGAAHAKPRVTIQPGQTALI